MSSPLTDLTNAVNHFMSNDPESTLCYTAFRKTCSMQLCVLWGQTSRGTKGIKRNNSCMIVPDGVWVSRDIVHCSDQSVWRWIRKQRLMWRVKHVSWWLFAVVLFFTSDLNILVYFCPTMTFGLFDSGVSLSDSVYENTSPFLSLWENTDMRQKG